MPNTYEWRSMGAEGSPGRQSRAAAPECSPRRKPWVMDGSLPSPEGAKEWILQVFITAGVAKDAKNNLEPQSSPRAPRNRLMNA